MNIISVIIPVLLHELFHKTVCYDQTTHLLKAISVLSLAFREN